LQLKDTLLDNNDMKNILGFKEAEINKKDQAAIKMMEEVKGVDMIKIPDKSFETKSQTSFDQT
jgi:hypothetical protein